MSNALPATLKFITSVAKIDDWKKFHVHHPKSLFLVCIGRSNVGKSSMLNMLFNQKIAHTSQKPGKTRLINIFQIFDDKNKAKDVFILDLPGYGFAHVSKTERAEWDKLLGDFFVELPDHAIFLCLQDSRHPFEPMDLIMLDFLNEFNQKKVLVLTKYDQLKTQKNRSDMERIVNERLEVYPFEYHFTVSNKSLEDRKEFIKHLRSLIKL